MNSLFSSEGIIINKKKSKESDLVLTILFPKFGKLNCVAKNVANIKSSRLSSLQLGNISKISVYQKDNSYWISESRSIESFSSSSGLVQYNLLFYILEICNQTIAFEQSIDTVYPLIKKIILAVRQNQLTQFIKLEIQLFNHLGFGVPDEIMSIYQNGDYNSTQKLLKKHIESIIEKPLWSHKLFN